MEHQLNWTPGSHGKGIQTPTGEVHTWNINPQTGDPIHYRYISDLLKTPEHFIGFPDGYEYREFNPFEIDPKGKVYGGPLDIDRVDPRLVPTQKWRFARIAHILGWQPGQYGKGLVHDGVVHTWNTGWYDGYPSHPVYVEKEFGNNIDWYINNPIFHTAFIIGPRGHMQFYENTGRDFYPSIAQADPRLKLGTKSLIEPGPWNFQANTKPTLIDDMRDGWGRFAVAVPWEMGQWGKGIYYPDTDTIRVWSDDRTHPEVAVEDENAIQGNGHHFIIRPNGTVRDQGAMNLNFDSVEGDTPGLVRALRELDPRLRLDPPATWDFDNTEPMEEEPSSISRGEEGGKDSPTLQTSNDFAGSL